MLILQTAWSKLKGPLLDAATKLCSLSKNHQWKSEIWLKNECVDKPKREKRAWFKVYNALKKGGMMAEAKGAKTAYIDAKRMAKCAVWLARSEAEKEELATVFPDGDGVFRIAKQMDYTNQDVVGENCVRNDAGELALTDEDNMKAWVKHYARLLNVEFEWPNNDLPEVPPTADPLPSVSATLIHKALGKIKCSKAAGPSGIVAEMLKAAGEEGVVLARQLVKVVFSCSVTPSDWEESLILNLHKGKGEALDHDSYCGLNLTDKVMKLLEWVLDSYICEMVNIGEMQFGFVPGRGTTDTIFVVRQLW